MVSTKYLGTIAPLVLLSSAALFPCAYAQSAPASGQNTPAPAESAPSQSSAPSSSGSGSGQQLKLESLPDGPGAQAQPGQPQSAQPGAAQQGAPGAPQGGQTGQAQQPDQQQTIAQQIRRLVAQEASWGTAISTPGVTLDIRESNREKSPAGTAVSYQLHTTGLTNDMPLDVLRWPLNGQLTPIASGASVDASGLVVCPATAKTDCGQTKPGSPVEVTLTAAKGEVERLAVVATDHKHGAASSVTPFPITADDKSCKMEVQLGTRNAELVLIRGEGFPPSTTVALQSESLGEKHTLSPKTDEKGNFVFGALPFVVGNDAGDTKISYTSATCNPSLSFHWGKNSYHAE
jgi:uncharacterized protein YoaH (UPF0181 family)